MTWRPMTFWQAIATDTNSSGKLLSNQISCSWFGFGGENVANAIQQFVAQGQSFFLASGDFGAYDNRNLPFPPYEESEVAWMTVVGGTQLSTTQSGAWSSEVTWDDPVNLPNCPAQGATGGGFLTQAPIPFYQAGIQDQIVSARRKRLCLGTSLTCRRLLRRSSYISTRT